MKNNNFMLPIHLIFNRKKKMKMKKISKIKRMKQNLTHSFISLAVRCLSTLITSEMMTCYSEQKKNESKRTRKKRDKNKKRDI
jgi:hypothetical protein